MKNGDDLDMTELAVKILVLSVATPVSWVMDGWALSLLWKWFVLPTFHIPAPSVAVCVGIVAGFVLLTHQRRTNEKSSTLEECAYSFCQTLFIVAVGFVAKGFM
jgi:hypothetical protein